MTGEEDLPSRSEWKEKEIINTSYVSYRRYMLTWLRVTVPRRQTGSGKGALDSKDGSGGTALLGQCCSKDWCHPSMALSPSRCGHESSPRSRLGAQNTDQGSVGATTAGSGTYFHTRADRLCRLLDCYLAFYGLLLTFQMAA